VIFDPAVYFGDRECDLAMSELFGGFAPGFYAAYREAWPLDAGYAVRKTLYNLYHVLNHANLFGGGYAAQAQRTSSSCWPSFVKRGWEGGKGLFQTSSSADTVVGTHELDASGVISGMRVARLLTNWRSVPRRKSPCPCRDRARGSTTRRFRVHVVGRLVHQQHVVAAEHGHP
jgi:hypothetical protein